MTAALGGTMISVCSQGVKCRQFGGENTIKECCPQIVLLPSVITAHHNIFILGSQCLLEKSWC